MRTNCIISPLHVSPAKKCPSTQEQIGEPEYDPSVLQIMLREEPGLRVALAAQEAEVLTAPAPMGASG